MKLGRALLAAALAALALAGCRYTAGGSLPAGIKTIGVTMLRNETRYPGLEGRAVEGNQEHGPCHGCTG